MVDKNHGLPPALSVQTAAAVVSIAGAPLLVIWFRRLEMQNAAASNGAL